MYKFIKNNQKKMLAVFGVLLMIVFIIPPSAKSGRGRSRRPIAKIGDTPVYEDQRKLAQDEWITLRQIPLYYQGRAVPYIVKLGSLAQEISEHPDLFMLLKLEAERQGITVSDDQIKTLVVNDFRASPDDERYQDIARSFLLVQALYNRVAENVKVTEPMWQRTIAERFQKVQLAIAELPVNNYRKNVPAPTTQQVQQQFDTYKHVDPSVNPKPSDDPLGFGYRTPTRIKLQYLELPHKAVVDAIRAAAQADEDTKYKWSVDARKYYRGHQDEFVRPAPQTQPTTGPTTAPRTGPASTPAVAATLPAPSTEPTTRPFAEVQGEIMDKLMEAPIRELQQKIQDAIAKRLDIDYRALHPANGSTPTTGPAETTDRAKFQTQAYLEQVALDIQKEFKVLPEVRQVPDPQNATQLAALPGIGKALTPDGKPFPRYATASDEAAGADPTKPEQTSTASPLSLYQPSDALTDSGSNVYFFRLTDYVPAHAPDLGAVASEVTVDVQTAKAYDDAIAAGRKLLDAARKDGLDKAARAQSLHTYTTEPFRPGLRTVLPELKLLPESVSELSRRAAMLLASASPDSADHPVVLVELPLDRKVMVIELVGATPDLPPQQIYANQMQFSDFKRQEMVQNLAKRYFDYDAVKERLQYHSEETDKSGT